MGRRRAAKRALSPARVSIDAVTSPVVDPPVSGSCGTGVAFGAVVGPAVGAVVAVPPPGAVVAVPPPGAVVAVPPPGAVVVVVASVVVVVVGAMRLVVIRALHVTKSPPPLADPLHWLIVTGQSVDAVEVDIEQVTRIVAPPPLPDPLHWVTSAPEVDPNGVQLVVGSVPPPPPDPMHWLIVAGWVEPTPVMLLTTSTLQVTIEPPAFAESLHWLTDPTMSVDADGVVTHVAAPGAPVHTVVVTLDPVTPVATSSVLTTLTSQRISRAAPVSSPLHWAIVTVAACAVLGAAVAANVETAIARKSIAAAMTTDRRRRVDAALAGGVVGRLMAQTPWFVARSEAERVERCSYRTLTCTIAGSQPQHRTI
jgi:hypothetical protein